VDQVRVSSAIDNGTKWLLQQDPREWAGHGEGTYRDHDLMAYTLLHAGANMHTPKNQEIIKKMVESPLEMTYVVALQAMFLQEFDSVKYQWRIAQCAQFLVDNQCRNGQWGYGEPTYLPTNSRAFSSKRRVPVATGRDGSRKPKTIITIRAQRNFDGDGDNSCAQYAILGLRACMEANVYPPKKTLDLALRWWKNSQNSDGGWAYKGSGSKSYGSMTVGAVGSVVILQHYLRKNWKRDKMVKKGVAWIAKNFSVKENPHNNGWHLYYLYAMERAGILTTLEKFGSYDWYKEGANYLVSAQNENGTWGGTEDTCFAILFLKRATPSLPSVASGRRR
ncbi:MAG: terpene cyclase/mutase family protein, partial [Planctomycetota bacterium]|nr:terpene cyclase/mutase family protein [Planctomycetota bacterium]